MKPYWILILVLITFACSKADEQPVSRAETEPFLYEFKSHSFQHDLTREEIPYSFFRPKPSLSQDEKFPLIIALHGAEYFFSTQEDFLNKEQTAYMALGWIKEEHQKNYPAFVVAPNLHSDLWSTEDLRYFGWTNEYSLDLVDQLIETLIATEKIDPSRIYLTGHSMGGVGTWYIGGKLSHKIAAMVPLSSAFSNRNETFENVIELSQNGAFKQMPIWSFIHKRDADGNSQGGYTHACRLLFQGFFERGYQPLITHNFGGPNQKIPEDELNKAVDLGKKHLYTEYDYPCNSDCHWAMNQALKEPALFRWLFNQRKD